MIYKKIKEYKKQNPNWTETQLNFLLNNLLNYITKYNIDVLTPNCIIECKKIIKKENTTFGQAKDYQKSLENHGEWKREFEMIIDWTNETYKIRSIFNPNNVIEGDLKDFDWNIIQKQQIEFSPYNITRDNIYGLSRMFYEKYPLAAKHNFFDEIKNPKYLKWINPWKGSDEEFKYEMDLLNSPKQQGELGAFYTPSKYIKHITKMVRKEIDYCKLNGLDYIIIDRCAGTGNLEEELSDEELSHCILSTYEIKEWTVLNYRLGDKIKCIIPPTKDNHFGGLLNGGNALDKDFYTKKYTSLDDKSIVEYCTDKYVIMLENPPFKGTFSTKHNKNQSKDIINTSKQTKQKWIKQKYGIDTLYEFIWTANEIIKPNAWILLSPIKYYKNTKIMDDYKYILSEGYILNRKHFHASEAAVSVLHFNNWAIKSNDELNVILEDNTFQPIELKRNLNKIDINIKSKNPETIIYVRKSINAIQIGLFKDGDPIIGTDNIKELSPYIAAKKCIHMFEWYETDFYQVSFNKKWCANSYNNDMKFQTDCLFYNILNTSNRAIDTKINETLLPTKDLTKSQQKLYDNWLKVKEIFGIKNTTWSLKLKELDTFTMNNGKKVYDDYTKHNALKDFIKMTNEFYRDEIYPKMKEYEIIV